jgi:hypothetical protein
MVEIRITLVQKEWNKGKTHKNSMISILLEKEEFNNPLGPLFKVILTRWLARVKPLERPWRWGANCRRRWPDLLLPAPPSTAETRSGLSSARSFHPPRSPALPPRVERPPSFPRRLSVRSKVRHVAAGSAAAPWAPLARCGSHHGCASHRRRARRGHPRLPQVRRSHSRKVVQVLPPPQGRESCSSSGSVARCLCSRRRCFLGPAAPGCAAAPPRQELPAPACCRFFVDVYVLSCWSQVAVNGADGSSHSTGPIFVGLWCSQWRGRQRRRRGAGPQEATCCH